MQNTEMDNDWYTETEQGNFESIKIIIMNYLFKVGVPNSSRLINGNHFDTV